MSKLTEEIKRLSRKIDNIDQRVEKIEVSQTLKLYTESGEPIYCPVTTPLTYTKTPLYWPSLQSMTFVKFPKSIPSPAHQHPKFKVGDKFIPHKPKDENESPTWDRSKDKYDGEILTVAGITVRGNLRVDVDDDDFYFNPSWCTKVEEEPKPRFKKGDWVRSLITGTIGKVEAFYEAGNHSTYLLSTIDGKKFTSKTNNLEPYFPKEGEYFHVVAKNSREEGISFIPATSEEKALLDSELAKRGLIFDGKEIVRDNTPKVGDLCIFWSKNPKPAVCDILCEIHDSIYTFFRRDNVWYKNCVKFESVEQFKKIKEGKI